MHDHVCWPYWSIDDLAAGVAEFLAEGVASGERVMYTADLPADELRRHLEPIDGLDELIEQSVVCVQPVEYHTGPDGAVDAAQQLDAYALATEAALADGFTGLRVAAEVTSLARTPRQRDAFGHWEHTADWFATGHACSGMCAYDADELGPQATAEMACLHPVAREPGPPFRLHAAVDADLALSGEVDTFGIDLLDLALSRIGRTEPGRDLKVDATELDFIDHHGVEALVRHARRSRASGVILRRAPSTAARVAGLMGLPQVRVEDPR